MMFENHDIIKTNSHLFEMIKENLYCAIIMKE